MMPTTTAGNGDGWLPTVPSNEQERFSNQLRTWRPPQRRPILREHHDSLDKQMRAVLAAEITAVQGEMARTETKASLLLAFSGVAASALAAVTPATLNAVTGGFWLAVGLLIVSAAVLLEAVRPRIPRSTGTGFVAYAATAGTDDLLRLLTEAPDDRAASHLRRLSRLTVRKYRLIHAAVVAMAAAVLAAEVAVLIGIAR